MKCLLLVCMPRTTYSWTSTQIHAHTHTAAIARKNYAVRAQPALRTMDAIKIALWYNDMTIYGPPSQTKER